MKKPILLIFLPLMFFMALSAQVMQAEADSIVIERMCSEIKPYTIYAKEDIQTSFELITSTGEALELGYSCWVYYVKFTDETNSKYLIVKENNGNLLEINAKNDDGSGDLENWRIIAFICYPIEIPFEDVSWAGTSCHWVNSNDDDVVVIINSLEELRNYITCANDIYPEIDFSIHTLILAKGMSTTGIWKFTRNIQQLSPYNYRLDIEFWRSDAPVLSWWSFSLIIDKVSEESQIELIVTYY